MSGNGDIIGGLIGVALAGALLIPLLIGGALIAGTVAAIKGVAVATKGISNVAREAHAANEQRRVNNVYSRASSLLAEAESVNDEMKSKMAETTGKICEMFTKSMEDINRSFAEEPDTSLFVEKYETARMEFAAEFQKNLETIERQYAEPMKVAVNKSRYALEYERNSILASINAMNSDIELRNEKSRAAAIEIIERTRTTISEFAECHKDNPRAHDYADVLNRATDTALERFDQGQYEAAIIDAYDAYAKCTVTVESLLAEDAKVDFLYERCNAAIAELKSHLESTSHSDFEFSDTLDGVPIKYENIDMSPYYAGARENVRQQLDQISSQLASKDKYGFTPEELIDLIVRADGLGMQYVRDTATAFERLYNHIDRIQMSDLIAETYAEMGFEEVEPDDSPSPLEAIVVQMENRESGECVKIFLGVKTDENSHISTSIDIYSHADDIDATTEKRRSEQREKVCRSLMNSSIGQKKGIIATQTCRAGTNGKNAF